LIAPAISEGGRKVATAMALTGQSESAECQKPEYFPGPRSFATGTSVPRGAKTSSHKEE
jgi:hypothetical protein